MIAFVCERMSTYARSKERVRACAFAYLRECAYVSEH